MKDKTEIHCPKCGWRPQPEDRWVCTSRCGTVWHTFWTRGVCPGCAVRWPHTQCFGCGRFSPHEAWYHEPPAPEAEEGARREKEGVV